MTSFFRCLAASQLFGFFSSIGSFSTSSLRFHGRLCQLCAWAVAFALGGAVVDAEDWPQWRGNGRDGVWTEKGVVEKFDAPALKALWRTPVNAGYSGPTVADGRVYLTDRVADGANQGRACVVLR